MAEMGGEERDGGEILDRALDNLNLSDEGRERLRGKYRGGLAKAIVQEIALKKAPEARREIIRHRVVEGVIFELAQIGCKDPVLRDLAGFGQPLPDDPAFTDAILEGDVLEGIDEEVEDRIEEILETVKGVADEQAAGERVGGHYYVPPLV
jgi:hypothetical protein